MATTWVTTIVLARLLTPSEYGLAGMAGVASAVLTLSQEPGLRAALIHRRERIQAAADAAAAYAPVIGIVLLGLCVAAAPLAALFFHRSSVTSLVRGLGFVLLLRALSQVPGAMLERELMFGKYTGVVVSGTLLQTASAITLAAYGAGAWAVVGGRLVFEAWSALLFWPLSPIRPDPRRASLSELRSLLRYGRHMVGANVSGFVNSYVDVGVIGRFLGSAALGIYTLGFQTGKQAVATVTYASNQVIFPAYAMLQDDPDRFRRVYLRSLRFISFVSVPAGVGLAVLSSDFIRVVYGTRWSHAGPVLATIALMGIVLSLSATMGEVLKAAGRPQLFFRLSLVQTTLVFVSVIVFYRFGIAAVAGCVAGSVTITGVVVGFWVSKILALHLADWIHTLRPSFGAGALMLAGMLGARVALGSLTSTARVPMLVALTAIGIVLYIVALRLTAPSAFAEARAEAGRLTGVRLSRLGHPTAS